MPSASTARWWLLGNFRRASPEERAWSERFLETLCGLCPQVQVARSLAGEFVRLVRERDAPCFPLWLERVRASGVADLKTFAEGLAQDRTAVEAALSSEWSNGQVEGQVNRLKFVKRSMYGRAGFDLLRARVLPQAA